MWVLCERGFKASVFDRKGRLELGTCHQVVMLKEMGRGKGKAERQQAIWGVRDEVKSESGGDEAISEISLFGACRHTPSPMLPESVPRIRT